MVLGAGILQLPAIIQGRKMGLKVIAVDMNPKAIGFEFADVALPISTIDTERVLQAAIEYKIDGIMTLASDMPMRTVAEVSEKLNLVGITKETAYMATDKGEMRKRLASCGVPVPKFFVVKDFIEYQKAVNMILGKAIVKPADNSGSRGIYLIEDKNNQQVL